MYVCMCRNNALCRVFSSFNGCSQLHDELSSHMTYISLSNCYMYMLGVLCCFALFLCLTLLASFFHLSFKNMYIQGQQIHTSLINRLLPWGRSGSQSDCHTGDTSCGTCRWAWCSSSPPWSSQHCSGHPSQHGTHSHCTICCTATQTLWGGGPLQHG